jgi:DNA-binding HxlR family transcriptional regulator
MDMPTPHDNPAECHGVSEWLSRVGDRWTMPVVVALYDQPRRFNEIKRHIGGISQQMLTRTLKTLQRDGVVERTVRSTTPPQVDYALTALGRSLSEPVQQLALWVIANRASIRDNRFRYDATS